MTNDKKVKNPAAVRTKGRRVEKDLPVILTDKELLNIGDEVSKLHEKCINLRIAKKAKTEELSGEVEPPKAPAKKAPKRGAEASATAAP